MITHLPHQVSGNKIQEQIAEQMRNRMRELETLRRGYKAQIQKEFPEIGRAHV